jgi:hypothetical protein
MNKKTKVIFKLLKGEVIALFPELMGDNNPWLSCLSYMHVGQHGSATTYLSRLEPATKEQYLPLFWELISIGYDLQVVKKFSRKMLQERIAQCDKIKGE